MNSLIEKKINSGKYPRKEALEEYYLLENHTLGETLQYFKIDKKVFYKLKAYFNIPDKSQSLVEKNKAAAESPVDKKIASGRYPLADSLWEFYIGQNHTISELCEKYSVSSEVIKRLLKKYGITKPRELSAAATKKTFVERYGTSNPWAVPEIRDKIEATNIERYGVSRYQSSEKFRERISRYDNSRTEECMEGILAKARETCQDRYGVDYPCMREEASLKGNDSGPNRFWENLLKEKEIPFEREFVVGNYRYDFKIGNTLLEIDPSATHNVTHGVYKREPLQKDYHYKKTQAAVENGFRCLHVFDWDDPEKIVSLLDGGKEVIGARKCAVMEVSPWEGEKFLDEHHLQGSIKSSVLIGLFYQGSLVSLMTFGKPRYNSRYDYELLRYCSSMNVAGGAQRLFSFFVKKYKPTSVISYCDRSKFVGRVYSELGFVEKDFNISRHWYNCKTGKHITDNLLRKHGFDRLFGKEYGCFGKGSSNEQLMRDHGFVEIYDAGQSTFVWTSSK